MIYLVLSILSSIAIFVVFKYIARANIPALPAIVVNYTICVFEGSIMEGPDLGYILMHGTWLNYAIVLGVLFISIFYFTSLTVKYSGLAVASIANKLSLVIPVIAAYFLYGDHFNVIKIISILLAMVAVVLAMYKKPDVLRERGSGIYIFPLIVLFGSGAIDSTIKYCQQVCVAPTEFNAFLVSVFGTAAVIGWSILAFRKKSLGIQISGKSMVYGILLGIPNYWTMYFLMAALNKPRWDSSTLFPVNNIAIVIGSCLTAAFLFKEKLSWLNLCGILLAVTSILLIMFA